MHDTRRRLATVAFATDQPTKVASRQPSASCAVPLHSLWKGVPRPRWLRGHPTWLPRSPMPALTRRA